MENWREDALSGHTHDPNEVTVQIDGLGRLRDSELVAAETQEASDKPVFVDESGSRGRRIRRIGWIMGVVCAVYAVVLVSTLASGNSDAPWMPDIGKDDKPASKVKPSPSPTGPGDATASTGTPPGPGESVAGAPDPTLSTGITGSPKPTGSASSSAKPSGKPTTTQPDPDPDPSTPDPDPSPSEPGPDPTTPDPDPTLTPDPPDNQNGGVNGVVAESGADTPADSNVLQAGAAL
ncbi:hypothetical protein H9Y04_37300 [Streptomyces sp. TRM66268-LWL]|uniref:Translation initiation factor IF-2 n=1 Tax=Streptomyces polyasparticus TaxID=2767826 RepID=A0ABR7SUC1_9ACTN|nr:hypothetical protein [Streptomyces polyasparticus]MBC9718197.1 hypothetical protein [Streptomyces polyasparticus]